MAQNDAERLTKLKQEIDAAKLDKAGIDAVIQQNMARLKKEFGCITIEQAKTKLAQMQQEKADCDADIADMVADLETRFTW